MKQDEGDTITACLECDLLLARPAPSKSREARCPRCGSRDSASRYFTSQTSLAVSLAALIVAIPAHLYPQMEFTLLGRPTTYTLTEGALALIDKGFLWVGGLILLSTVVAPLLLLVCIALISLLWSMQQAWAFTARLLKLFHYITSWAMLDVYLLSVIVSVVKLLDMGKLELSTGFFCFVAMLVLTTAATLLFNSEACWNAIEKHQHAGD
ncbi:paraquat-inducible protein A [Gilvimarinus sp. SDUM040013]|uniref:Paraquat-inducible protein A n=1 Tax=Gilvimarinus gilvus TaxID=3058038 RepID=A0ABU4S3B0_9GAMM|nr:paraquat-inducible protein A [Gilvimarinus sp. SDUM040013]MDO3384969.1 paraquat-inducible protein A [Gilvimarinus sp. SDUM040013]MDX6851495.1 paraquat-inducible protein A [Gilvimarinus sp. SDUM040013]